MTAQAKKLNSADKKALPPHIYDTFIVGAGISGIATAIRLDQVGFGSHFRFFRSSALARTMSFRMMAVMATFAGFPACRCPRGGWCASRSGCR